MRFTHRVIHATLRALSCAAGLSALVATSGCDRADNRQTDKAAVYTLYRDSVVGESPRVHVATFDAAENEPYNHDNCSQAQSLFQNQRGVQTHYWCEKGRFKKAAASE